MSLVSQLQNSQKGQSESRGKAMVNQNGRIPIAAGRKFCEENKLTQVVIIARTVKGTQCCMTYGVTMKDCENAAVAGRFWERVIGLGTKRQAAKAIRELLAELESDV